MKKHIIYPDGSGHSKGKFTAQGVKALGKIGSANILVGKELITIHADRVSFDGARLTAVLDSIARELVRLRKRIEHFEYQEKLAKKKAGG